MSDRTRKVILAAMREVSKDMKTLHQWVSRAKGEEDRPDPRCCPNLSPRECSSVPGRICTGMDFTKDHP